MIRNWDRTLPNHILVSAQGYEKSWNITKERSKAPDVEFVEMILRDVTSHYPQADDSKVSLIGSSNGAGMVYRLLIELDDTYSIQNALAFVSSMTVSQYHDEQFWKRTDETTSNYDQPVEPSGKRRIITIHGSADSVVPYYGGRGPGGIHLSAQDTAYVWATVQGYRGDQRPDNEGKPCGEKLLMYDYPQSGVTHIKVIDGGHGLGPAAAPLKPLLMKMLGWSGDS
jgi:poly(3-hydroxybutyrate) depolymerase